MNIGASRGRTLILAVDGLDDADVRELGDGDLAGSHPVLAGIIRNVTTTLRVRPGGPSEPAPALTSLVTGASVAHTGVATELPFAPDAPAATSTWSATSLTTPTLFDMARRRDMVTAALQWPVTAGADIDLCLPLVEDLGRYRNRWEMAERTSSARMVREHLAARRAAGVQLSQVPPDALVAEIAADICAHEQMDLMAIRLTGLGLARRCEDPSSVRARRALVALADALQQILAAFAPTSPDRVVMVPGRPLVTTHLLVHPNAALAEAGLIRTAGTRLDGFRALVWPDGPRGVLHVRRDQGEAVRRLALEALTQIAAPSRLRLRRVDDGVGATAETDVIAVLEGAPGTVFGLSATHRPLVDGGDPYYAGPRAVTDPSAAATALAVGPGLPLAPAEGVWADLGVTLARAMGLELPGATVPGMRPVAAMGGG